jgi:hypothetical protein
MVENYKLSEEQEKILLDFQAITQEEDTALCLQALSEHGWDLTQASQYHFSKAAIYAAATQNTSPPRPPPHAHPHTIPEEQDPLYSAFPVNPEYPSPPNVPISNLPPEEEAYQPQRLVDPDPYSSSSFGYTDPQTSVFNDYVSQPISRAVGAVSSGIKKSWDSVVPKAIRGYSPGGEEFINKFKKCFAGLEIPKFVHGTFDDVCKRANSVRMPLFLYLQNCNIKAHRAFLQGTLCDKLTIEVLDANFISLGLDSNSKEGKKIMQKLSITHLPNFSIIIVDRMNNPQTLGNMYGQSFTAEKFQEFLASNLEGFHALDKEESRIREEVKGMDVEGDRNSAEQNAFNRMIQQMYDQDEYNITSHSQAPQDPRVLENRRIKEMQQKELREAEQRDLEKALRQEEERKQELEAQAKAAEMEAEKLIREEERKASIVKKKKALKAEPEEGNPEAAEIALRLPSGKRVQRRFMKHDVIQRIYDFIETLEIDDEEDRKEYVLMQAMPRVLFQDRQLTIHEAGLFPKALLHVKVL